MAQGNISSVTHDPIENRAVRTFLHIKGIEGPSKYGEEEGSVELLGMDHAFEQPIPLNPSEGSAPSLGRAKHGNITLLKQIDASTVPMLKSCWAGKIIDEAVITSYNGLIPYLRIFIELAVINKHQITDSPDQIGPTESISLSYSKIKYEYTPIDQQGNASGKVPVSADLMVGAVA